MTVTVKGQQEVVRNVRRLKDRLERESKRELKQQARKVLDAETTEVPVDTGQLKASHEIDISNNGLEAAIGSNDSKADYNVFVQFGHRTASGSFVPPNHWITRAFNKTKKGVVDSFTIAYKTILR